MQLDKQPARPRRPSLPPAIVSEHLLSPRELGDILSKSLNAIHHMRQRGMLPAPIKLGRSLRWRASDINAWLAAAKT